MGSNEVWKKMQDSDDEQSYFDVKAEWEKSQSSEQQNADQQGSGYFNVREQWINRNIGNIMQDIYDRYTAWHDNSNQFYQTYNKRFQDRKWNYEDAYVADSAQWLDAMKERRESLDKEASEITSLIESYGSYIPDKDFLSGISGELRESSRQYDDIIGTAQQDAEYWKTWDAPKTGFRLFDDTLAKGNYGQVMYTKWQEERKYTEELLNLDIPAAQVELTALKQERDAYVAERNGEVASIDYVGDLPYDGSTPYDDEIAAIEQKIADSEYLRKYTAYAEVMRAKDYATASQYVSTYDPDAVVERIFLDRNGGAYTYYDNIGFTDPTYAYINKDPEATGKISVNDISTDASLLGLDDSFLHTMTEDEIGIFNYLYATQSPEKAYEYINFLTSELTARDRALEQQEWAKYAEEHPVKASIFSTLISPMKGLSYLGQAADYLDDGSIDQNAAYNKFSYIPSTIRGTVSEAVKKGWSGEVGSFLYNTGMSMADFLYSTGISGGNQALTLAIMGTGAAADSTIAAKDRGLSDDQAFAIGTIAGIAEVAMEKISLGAWLEGDLSEGALKYLLKNALSEGGEEVGTDVINLLADVMIAGDKSEWKTAMNAYIAEGKTEAEAFGLVAADQALQMGLDFLGGALSGAVIAGGTYAGSSIAANHNYGDIAKNGGYVNALVSEALEIDPNNPLALRMQGQLQAGKNVTALQVQELIQQNETGMEKNDRNAIQTAAENRLTELGETGDVSVISAALAKQAVGETLTIAERRAIRGSRYGTRVANELNIENIDSGDFSSDWAQRIGTDRINADSYGRLIQDLEAEDAVSVETDMEEPTVPPTADRGGSPNKTFMESAATAPNVEPAVTTTESSKSSATTTVAVEPAATTTDTAEADEDTNVSTSIQEAAKSYGKQAGAFIAAYNLEEGKQDVAEFDAAYRAAYDMGMAGVSFAYANKSNLAEYLTETQKEWAYNVGADAATEDAARLSEENAAKANRKTGRKKGSVRGENVSVEDLKKSFNDAQNTAYKVLSFYAEVTGIDIVLYKSEADAGGNLQGAQGRYKRSEPGTIYIDINAGLENVKSVEDLAKYTMLRTFAHEFVHFIENWNPVQYNEFRKVIFETLTARGENVQDLIEAKQAKQDKLSYDMASREVVAEAMTDILPDSKFAQELAENHKRVFQKLLDMLKEFLADIQAAFKGMGGNRSREANALKQQVGDAVHYLENIVEMFDKMAAAAVENYQKTVAVEEETQEEVYISEHGYTVTDDATDKVTAIQFKKKPSNLVREALKNNAFVWSKTKSAWTRSGKWYGKTKLADVIAAIDQAYAAASEAESDSEPAPAAPKPDVSASEVREADPKENKEVTSNAQESENGTDTGTVQPPVLRGEAAPRLLDGVETGAVQRGSEGRGSARAGEQQGRADDGSDSGADAEGNDGSGSTGDRVGGRVRELSDTGAGGERPGSGLPDAVPAERTDDDGRGAGRLDGELSGVTQEERQEELHGEVQEKIEQKSTAQPKGSNFVIGDSLDLPNGTKARVRANIEAIHLVKQLIAEGRTATAEEQAILSKYVGWGGLPDAFGKPSTNWNTRKVEYNPVDGLEKEFAELKDLLTEEEYRAARESTKNAHYTSIEVIKAMYDGLAHLGFTGGRMLEPSSGVGNFVGAMPPAMTATVKSWTMVELDAITGRIAKYLYPHADVRIQGFEETNLPDGYMDVAIGNVPFGDYGITDKHYPKTVTKAIHNYFFAKALDKVRPGGLVMFITSSFTMDGRDSSVRKYIMDRADLLGAVRLPNTAFAGNAGTQVVTDILILKKRAYRTEYAGEAFERADWHPVDSSGTYINDYFINHPEMVLGTAKMARGMYSANSLTYEPFTDRGSLGDQIRNAIGTIQSRMEYSHQASPEESNFAQQRGKKKRRKLQVENGVIFSVDEYGNAYELKADQDTTDRITGMVAIRDAYTALVDALQQGVNANEATKLRKRLNSAYDSFVKKYGFLNAPKNKKAVREFADSFSILSLENYNAEKKTAAKTDIFTKNTIAANRTADSAENVEEGLTISLNAVGTVDTSMIARLTGQKVEEVTRQLIDRRLVFKDKDGNLIPAEQYLSGNVRAKLREMEGLVGIDADYRNNVEALKAVVPETIPYTDIYVNPGASWIPASVYEDFVGYILDRSNHTGWRTGKKDFQVEYVPETNEYKVSINDAYAKGSARNTQVWGESGKSFHTIFENILNGRRTNVYMDDPDGKRVIDRVKTEAVNEKAEKISEEFRKWLWSDESRRAEMQELYNQTYNALVTPKYSGEGLTVNGLNAAYTIRPHQLDAIARIINSGGNTLLAHRVGAGKTMEMAAAAMKLKQLGIIKKPMFVVPNNVVAQWGVEFKSYFPAANILVVGDTDMTAAERMTTINRIKNNDYDAVILAYTKFEKIQMSKEWRERFYEEQIENIVFAINAEKEASTGKSFTVKQLEGKRKQLQNRLKKLTDKAKDEEGAMFDDLGVDALFVDEAHNFKNLEYTTRMSNVSGLGNSDGSQRAFDLYTKIRYLQQLNGGRGIVFATATPVMNSMTEMYIMQRYLQPDTMEQLGIDNFDSWSKMFGEVVNALEIAPSGSGYRVKQTFSKFKNVKALQQLFRSFTDVLTDVPGLTIPKMKGGKVQFVECQPSEFQENYMAELAERAEKVKSVDPHVDNMLKITSDGRRISYSQRMIDPSLPYEEGGKIYRCCENVFRVWQESSASNGTQMIFCDMATPKGKASTKADTDTATDEFGSIDMESAQLYDDMKARLIQLGIPAKEIAFIHDAKNDKQKAALAEKMNDGTIRVLIGSTGKMGVGLNAQVKAVAIHHLDAPWRPGDIEQRDGRVFRQKNQNPEAYKFVYLTKGSFDARLWDILERKQKFINQIMNGEDVGNEVEDTGQVTLSAAEAKAVASGNPLIQEEVMLAKELSKLESLQQAHDIGVRRAREMIVADERRIAELTDRIAKVQEDIKSRKDTYSDDNKFSMQIGSQTFTGKKEAGAALIAAAQAKAVEGNYTTIGKFAGFPLRVVKTGEGIKGIIAGSQNYDFKTYPLNPTYGINHLIALLEGLDGRLQGWKTALYEANNDLKTQKQLAAEPFAQAEKLREKRKRYQEVMDILNPPKEQAIEADVVQEQSRDYLSEGKKYSYAWFIAKPDMAVPLVSSNVPGNRADVIYQAKQNAAKIGKFNPKDSSVAVHVDDIDSDVILGTRGLQHGLDRRFSVLAPVTLKAGEILKNSIRVNEMIPKAEAAAESYVLIGAASGVNGEFYIVRSVVNRYSNELTSIDVLYAINAKKEPAGRLAPRGGQHDGSNPSGSTISIAALLDIVNQHFPEILPEDVLKHYGHASRPDGPLGDDVLYQERTSPLTDRDVLELAANEIKVDDLTDGEQSALQIFKNRLTNLQELQEQRAELGRLYREQQFGPNVDRAEAEKTLNRMKVLDDQIKKAAEAVLDVEKKEVLSRVLKKARKVVELKEREHGQELLSRYRDRRNEALTAKKYRERIRKEVDELSKWVLKPDAKNALKHVPDALKNPVISFLTGIDLSSKQKLRGGDVTKADNAFLERLEKLHGALKENIDLYGMYSGYNDLPAGFMEDLQRFISTANELVRKNSGEFVINQMSSSELRDLYRVIKVMKTFITQVNKFHSNAMFQHVSDAGDSSIAFLDELKQNQNAGAGSNFLLWQNMRPAYAFERFGDGGVAIYDELRQGQSKLAFNTRQIIEFAESAYTEKEVKAWEKEVKTLNMSWGKAKLTVAQMMGFYELSKQPDSLRHLQENGLRVATYKNGKEKISDVGHELTAEDFNTIIDSLTPRQKEVADKLQQYMATQGAAWGNYVSVARFGEELFSNPHYYPINSDGRHLDATAEEQPNNASLYALLNMSFTKQRNEHANNRIVLYSIFDVFSNHMASMAQYNALALPVLDALKWFNYRQTELDEDGNKHIVGSVREGMDRAFGVPEETKPGRGSQGYAESFVVNIIKSFNGTEAQGTPNDSFGLKQLHTYNRAQVAYNLRVVLQQPLAITRAGLLLDHKAILRGLKASPSTIRKNIAEMQKHSGIAAWKDLGFYDVNISRSVVSMIKHDETITDKITEKGMWLAEQADKITWAAIWNACKEQVARKQGLKTTDDGFYEAVTKLFEDVIYKTQVVDSILTKNEYMRDKGFWSRMVSSFMSEPVTTISMVVDAFYKYRLDLQRGMTKQQAWKKNGKMIARTVYVYAIGAVLLAAVQAAADAWRDDDDYQSFAEKWLEAFGGNLFDELNPLDKLPVVSDIYEGIVYSASSMLNKFAGTDIYANVPKLPLTQLADQAYKAFDILSDLILEEDTNYTWYGGIFKVLQAVSGATGLPLAAATREVISGWNNTIGAMAPSLKIKSYEVSGQSQIKYAYQDGYLTEAEAIQKLIEQGFAKDEDEAFFTVQSWEGRSKYDDVYEAVKNGGSIDGPMQVLLDHGYTRDEVISQVKTQIGIWYRGTDTEKQSITKQQAIDMLRRYTGMSEEEITKLVNKWSCKVVTGIEYDDIKQEYLDGNITAQRAVEMYMRYGGYTKEEAQKRVDSWLCEMETGIAYNNLKTEFLDGNVTAEKAMEIYMNYGGYDQKEASEKVTVLEFVKEHPEADGISYAALQNYTVYCESAGMEVQVYYDCWKYCNAVNRDDIPPAMKKKNIADYINSLDITEEQRGILMYIFYLNKAK